MGVLRWVAPETGRFQQDPWKTISFRWQPVVSCESRGLVGLSNQKTEVTDLQTAQLMGKVRGDLRLDFLTPRLIVSGNYLYGQKLSTSAAAWDLTTISWTYQLSARASFEGSFTQGRRVPSVQKAHDFKMELGIKF